MNPYKDYLLTFDIDWAPDWIIDQVADMLIEHNVKATWFVTHMSPAVDRLRQQDRLFELGIHPNMLPGSTHGTTEDEVLAHVMALVPDAVSMRTHGLYQSTNFLKKAARDYGIKNDVSLFLPNSPYLTPHILKLYGTRLCRIPYFWEDDFEMNEESPCWELSDPKFRHESIGIFDFHPVHVALNTDSFSRYEDLKRIRPVSDWTPELVKQHVNPKDGPKTLLLELLLRLENGGHHAKDLSKEVFA